ncbi:hypothetical protein AArcS_0151 [Natranaeroarchaeum sulfidigenes]|uniref:Uncharacterized protein n=1 Tax=Natranaeroarchaeum sulfidigenes TaxID=2784880 RepID=A0A897MLZ6_9EURY|nr:hypothetical protein AArcS_0151 [Natranaeroarchaeum sulfidigenes]
MALAGLVLGVMFTGFVLGVMFTGFVLGVMFTGFVLGVMFTVFVIIAVHARDVLTCHTLHHLAELPGRVIGHRSDGPVRLWILFLVSRVSTDEADSSEQCNDDRECDGDCGQCLSHGSASSCTNEAWMVMSMAVNLPTRTF